MLVVDFSFTEAPPSDPTPCCHLVYVSPRTDSKGLGFVLRHTASQQPFDTATKHGCVHVKFHKQWDILDTRWGYVCLHFMPVTNPIEMLSDP